MADLTHLSEALQRADAEQVRNLTTQALRDGLSPGQILSEGLLAGMDVVGVKFKNGDLFIPEVLVVAKAMHAGLEILRPKLVETGVKPVGMMLQGAGFEVIDIGIDCPPERFVEAAGEEGVQIVGMSALLTTTMTNMRDAIEVLREAGLGKKVKTMIGGAVVSQKFADEIGADGYAPDAASAVEKARALIGR